MKAFIKKHLPFGMIFVFIAAGLGLILYPCVSQYLAQENQSSAIVEYDEIQSVLSYSEKQAQLELARAYNNSIRGQPVMDPFIEGSGSAVPGNYDSILNYEGIMGYIRIPKIDVNIPIAHGVGEATLKSFIGHIPETAIPVGGEGNHSVLCGHRGMYSARLFTDLDKMQVGNVFYVTVLDETLAYRVDAINVVTPDDTSLLKSVPGEDYVTLLTCTPYRINSHRLLVRGTRIPYEEAVAIEHAVTTEFHLLDWISSHREITVAAAFLFVFAGVSVVGILTKKRRKKK